MAEFDFNSEGSELLGYSLFNIKTAEKKHYDSKQIRRHKATAVTDCMSRHKVRF